ncbi:MAG: hypothetical protein ACRDY0_12120, partial [Acidimicrobiales bacterium]
GSTEISVGPADLTGPGRLRPHAVRSVDLGCVRVTERWLVDDPPAPAQLRDARAAVDAELDALAVAVPATTRARTLVGLAGTVSCLAALDQGLETYDHALLHHYRLGAPRVEAILAGLAGEPAEARVRRPGMEPGRADVIVGGAVVLAAVMARFGLATCLCSQSDILDGLIMSLRAQPPGASSRGRALARRPASGERR